MEAGFKLVSGGTDNHLLLLDLRDVEITGLDAEKALDEAGITVNKNTIPFESRGPSVTSGIRLGSPAVTTRGMKEPEMALIASFIVEVLQDPHNEKTIRRVSETVQDLCKQFPLYPED
jgi:glycine hydroxymethyltransferase